MITLTLILILSLAAAFGSGWSARGAWDAPIRRERDMLRADMRRVTARTVERLRKQGRAGVKGWETRRQQKGAE